jgi:DNA-binding beta-propeller fold protein YncE
MKPRDVTVDRRRIYVADIQSRLVRVYDKASRKWLLNIPCDADRTNAMHALYIPTNLAVDSRGRLYVADTGACHVQVYDASGNYLRTIGALGDGTGEFARVKGLAIDRENRIYAADAMSGVIQIFDDQGQVLTWFGDPENGGLMQNLPAKVLLDYDDVELFQRYAAPNFKIEYLIIVTNQLGPHKICVYGFGHMK